MRILTLFILMLLPVTLSAQQKYFLYVQGENQQPFYVKMEGVIFSSSASGFILLPRLGNGVVDLIIGFPRAQWPEYSFSIEMKSADRGLILKNEQNKGWNLYDLQSNQIMQGVQLQTKPSSSDNEKKKTDDPFASSLAAAISDPGIKDVDLVTTKTGIPNKTTTPVSPVPQTIKENKDSLGVATPKPVIISVPAKVDEKPISLVPIEKPFINIVEKIKENRNTNTIGLVFLDKNGDQTDTVELIIEDVLPVEPAVLSVTNSGKDSVVQRKELSIKVSDTVEGVQATATAMPQVVTSNKDSTLEINYEKTAATSLPTRKDCKQVAVEKDMINARKKAYSLGSDTDIILLYTKEVKSKCYTVSLVQALSFAFVQDSSRFQFFQEAYPWVMDPANYPQLERLFVSKEYVSKFKKLINAE